MDHQTSTRVLTWSAGGSSCCSTCSWPICPALHHPFYGSTGARASRGYWSSGDCVWAQLPLSQTANLSLFHSHLCGAANPFWCLITLPLKVEDSRPMLPLSGVVYIVVLHDALPCACAEPYMSCICVIKLFCFNEWIELHALDRYEVARSFSFCKTTSSKTFYIFSFWPKELELKTDNPL